MPPKRKTKYGDDNEKTGPRTEKNIPALTQEEFFNDQECMQEEREFSSFSDCEKGLREPADLDRMKHENELDDSQNEILANAENFLDRKMTATEEH